MNQIEFTDIHYALGAKGVLLRIYYETNETEPLYSLLSSFHLYLIRNTLISQNTRDAYLNFVRLTKQLLKQHDASSNSRLQQQIRSTAALTARSWLLQQAQKLAGARVRNQFNSLIKFLFFRSFTLAYTLFGNR